MASRFNCLNAFRSPTVQASFANEVLFFVALLGIFIALFILRRKSIPGTQLLGAPLIICLAFFLLTYLCSIVATVLRPCETTRAYSPYFWNVAIIIFQMIGYWLLLVVVVFTLNTMLRRQLSTGHSNSIFKIVPLAIIGLTGALACVVAGMTAYVNAEMGRSYASRYRYRFPNLGNVIEPLSGIRVAFYSLYLVSLLVAGALALKTVMSLRKAGRAGGGLVGWVIALTISMMLWTICTLVAAVWNLQALYVNVYTVESYLALAYLSTLGQVLSFIFILCIAKHGSWKTATGAEPMAYQPQYSPVANQSAPPYQPYGYNNNVNGQANQQHVHDINSNGQANHYHEAPEYVGTNNTVRA